MAEIEVGVLEDKGGRSSYLSIKDPYRLDDFRDALHKGDLSEEAAMHERYGERPGLKTDNHTDIQRENYCESDYLQ
ncbi:MAG: hypothetical protein KGY56_13325 [Desulfobacterales bacterium]|nr:hypothetical protein [Desulfobacterales bacterium]